MVKLVEYPRTATIAWSHDKVPLLATGTASGTVDADFSSTSSLELWSVLAQDATKPLATITADAKFNDLDWSKDNSVIAGALENGIVEFYSPKEKKSITKVHKHTKGAKTLRFNAKQNNVLVSGGSQGEIFVWDVNKITTQGYSPFGPGNAMTPIDEVQSLAWNQSLAHVFASAGSSGFASIWDLKAMKEVIHLSYTSPNSGLKNQLSVVEWHPNNSTRVATATGNDNEPVILVWDLRNANTPLQVLSQGHSKGIISLDWCLQDEQLMLSSGRDNSCILWNPETAQKLTQYPTRGNWCFKTKFAPEAPELFASASFDNKVEVQTLQNLENKLDLDETAYKQQESETEFWNNVSQTESKEKPIVTKLQAPSWYGNRSPAAQWAFGGKVVQITPDHKGVNIFKPSIEGFEKNSLLNEALQSKDFTPIINKRLAQTIDHTNEEDWTLLETLSMDGKDAYLKESMSLDDGVAGETKEDVQEEDFFNNLTQRYTPEGPFNFDLSPKNLVESLVSGNLSKAVNITLDKGLLLESLMIALNSDDDTLKQRVREAYFAKFASNSSLARTLYSISERRVDDLVDNAAVSQWKYIVKAINTYSAEKDRNDLLIRLGDRLLQAGERQNALVLYLAGHSLDKIAAIWLKELPALESQLVVKKNTLNEAHLECLTEFIERFTVLSSYLNNGADLKLTNAELIAKFLEFVSFSSSSGDFDLALKFLDTLPADNKQVETEKQRVLIASGRTTGAPSVRKPKYGSMPQNVIGSPMAVGGIPPTAQLNDRTYSYNVPSQNVFSPGAPVSSARAAPYGQNTSSYQAAAVSPPKRYAPVGGSLSNGTGTSHNPMPSISNPYAPPSGNAFAPSPNAFAPPVASAAPSAPGVPYNQSYPNNQLNQKPISPPLDSNSRIVSGQSPHLNRGANNGWNDLPEIIKEKKVRAKAVSTAPINSPVTPGYQANSGNASAMVPPPPPLSRVTSNTSVSNLPPPPPSSKTPQGPPMNPPSALSSQAYPTPPANPYAVPARTTSYTAPSNPYAPPPPSSIPVNSPPTYAAQSTPAPPSNFANSTTPSLAQQKPISGPPPKTMSRKSNVGTKDVKAANEFLHSIQKMPPSSATTPPQAPPVLQAQQGAFPPPAKQHEVTPNESVAMPPEYQAIADFLNQELARVTPLVPAEFNKQLKDCSKRLNILHAHLEKQDLLTPPTIAKLQNLVALMKEHRYADALAVHVDLATNHAQEAGNWLTGVKRLIGLAEATSN